MKPILSIDFDGVIHSYSSGWKGVATITSHLQRIADALERAYPKGEE